MATWSGEDLVVYVLAAELGKERGLSIQYDHDQEPSQVGLKLPIQRTYGLLNLQSFQRRGRSISSNMAQKKARDLIAS